MDKFTVQLNQSKHIVFTIYKGSIFRLFINKNKLVLQIYFVQIPYQGQVKIVLFKDRCDEITKHLLKKTLV